MKAVVVSHGAVDPGDVRHARDADLVVAADGGADHLTAWGIEPHVVVGDLDSLGPEQRERLGSRRLEAWPREKDKTDTELAIERAIASGADEVVIVGALGGPRVDHSVANILTLALPRAGKVALRLAYGPLSMRALRAGERVILSGAVGDLVTLLAVGGDAVGVTTEGLRYPLRGETLALGSSRGVSNEVQRAGASVSLRSGTLLVVEGGALEPQPKA